MITICCLKKGDAYKSEYVNKLFNMVNRNCTVPFDFVCFTENIAGIDGHIRTAPLPYDAKKWWGKMGLYQERIDGVETEKLLFLDLDTVITGSLDPICNFKSDFALAKDYPYHYLPPNDKRQKWGNTSVILLKVGSRVEFWTEYLKDRQSNNFQWLQFGDQEWLYSKFYGQCDLLPEQFVQSYKLHNLKGENKPDCSVVMFHGTPKPPDCGGWVKELWR